ncbi:meiotically up-regulated gene 113-domain-containing protein [Aspergillus egyptiacus]|nr:meiotically up-regulated gene 113-domain-containing protein [Aspergillus egyptiacus]
MTAIVREDVEQTTNDLTESAFCTSHRKAMRNRVGARLGPSPWSDESSSFRILRQQLEVVLTGKEAVVMEDLEPGWNLKPPVYAPYFRIESEGKSITQRLLEVLIQPLTAKDVVHEAHIYIYWIDAAPVGHVKIGYARDVEARLKQWEGGCNRPLQRYFPNALEEIQPVPHALRVETLIHTELEAYRRVEPRCPECGKEHAEWFEVAGEVAARVVRKWMTWMRERPYVEEKGRDGRPSWVLDKEKGIGRLAELSTPIPLSCSAGNETEALGSRLTVPGGNCSRQRRYSNTV